MSAAALPAGAKQLTLVAALRQCPDDARAARLRVGAVLLEHESQVLTHEL